MGWNVIHKRVLDSRFRLALVVFASVLFTDDSSVLSTHMPGENDNYCSLQLKLVN